MKRDISNFKFTITAKNAYQAIATVAVLVAGGAGILFSLKSDVAEANRNAIEAKNGLGGLSREVAHIKCLLTQQNNFQMYGIKPKKECSTE